MTKGRRVEVLRLLKTSLLCPGVSGNRITTEIGGCEAFEVVMEICADSEFAAGGGGISILAWMPGLLRQDSGLSGPGDEFFQTIDWPRDPV
jgi:hypothetical protein